MSVYRTTRRKTYQYDFSYRGKRYKGNTGKTDRDEALLVETKHKLRLRTGRGAPVDSHASPTFTEWAGVYWSFVEKRLKPKRPEKIEELLRVVLRFWGRKPTDPEHPVQPQPGEDAPFHDLRLCDPIDDPSWILKWDEWIDKRNVAGGTRNHYNSRMRQLYVVAQYPEYRQLTGVTSNPFEHRRREPKVGRKVTLTRDQVLAWIGAMSYHTRLAVSIAALAPALRLRNVLDLRRDEHLDRELTKITLRDHKTDRAGTPIVSPISDQLRAILKDALKRNPPPYVVTYRGKPVRSIRRGLEAAAKQVAIPYGRYVEQGVTFHTLRHTASTIFAELGTNPWLHRDAMGHRHLDTTALYTHVSVEAQRPILEQLSAQLPVAELVTAERRRASRQGGEQGGAGGPSDLARENRPENADVRQGPRRATGRPFARKH